MSIWQFLFGLRCAKCRKRISIVTTTVGIRGLEGMRCDRCGRFFCDPCLIPTLPKLLECPKCHFGKLHSVLLGDDARNILE
jgi:hypothetical protein